MSTERPPTIDSRAAAHWAELPHPPSRAVSPWLHEEVARRMEERLQWIVKIPQRWLHWAPLRGGLQAQALLEARYPKSECFVLETPVERAQAAHKLIAKNWWSPGSWRTKAVRFDVPAQPVDMLWANMALHMEPDPLALIERWHSLVEADGFVMFSCLGPDTLRQLRAVYAEMGWPPPAHEFTDMHDWGDMLARVGFAEPVMDMEHITLTFTSAERLLAELRELGRNLHPARFAGLRGRGWRERLLSAITQKMGNPMEGGRLELTFEIIYGHAFKPQPRIPVQPQTTVTLDAMRKALRQGKP
jgi:malonyl-CoA O-methyltransferase